MTKMHPLTAAIRGYGGGGSSSSTRTPVESPDSLRSVAMMRILDLVSEGEIYGFADQEKPLTCVFFNETPVENSDGSFNFENFLIESRTGTQTQDYIPGFDAVESENGVNVELTASVPWTRNFTNLNLDAIRLRLSVPTLLRYQPNGDVVGTRVDYKIELSTDGGAFVEVVAMPFVGKTTTKFERSHLIQLPRATTQWTLRVTRITPASDSGTLQNQTFIEGFTEIIDVKLRLPMSATVGVVISAEQFGNAPSRAYRLKGRIIKVPSNYNAETRTYTGIWDGTFQPSYTNNPAWVFYDMAMNPRYGLGHLLEESYVSKWALYKIAQFCDELVPDGFGGMEPRFTANLYLQQQGDAMQVMQDMATMFRGIMYAAGGTIQAVADAPDEPVYHFNQTNVIDGKFAYTGSSRKVRHTVALVSWNDMSDFGRAKIEYVDDPDGISRYGVQQTELIAIGCTSRGQARRWGKYALTTARIDSELVAFDVGLDGTIPAPGKVVTISDPLRAGKRMGGRLRSATINSVTVDVLPEVAIGHTLTVTLPDGTIQKRTINSIVGNTFGVSANFTSIPAAQSVWMVENPTLVPQTVRILGITERSDGKGYSIAAIKHTPGKYAFVEEGLKIEDAPISGGYSKIVFAPASIVMTHRDVADYNTTQKIVTLTWPAVEGATYYNVLYRVNQGSWVDVGTVTATTVDIQSMPPGVFEVSVTAINGAGYRSQPAYAGPFDIDPNIKPPGFLIDINTSISDALTAAENAQATADGAVVTFWQGTPPAIGAGAGQAKVGDIWFNTSEGNKIYRVVGSSWVDAQDDALAAAILAAANAQATADGKVTLFVGTVPPTSGMQLNDMFFNTSTKKTFRYNGADWNTPIADVTLDQLGGNGVNLLPDQYSTFSVLPPTSGSTQGTHSLDAAKKVIDGALKIAFPATANIRYFLGALTGTVYLKAGTYIVSGWIASSVASQIVAFNLRSAGGVANSASLSATSATVGQMSRLSCRITIPTDGMYALGVDPTDTGSAIDYWIDGIMVEEAIGNLNRPSTYVRGTAAGQAISALIAAQNAQATADGVIDIFPKGGSPPTGAKFGDYWQDANGKWWYWNGAWTDATDSRLPQVVLDTAAANSAANTAQATANSKVKMFALPSTTPPSGQNANDQWYQTDTKATYYWNGSGWSLLADQTATNPDFVGVKTTVNSTGRGVNLIRNSSFAIGTKGWAVTWDSAGYGDWDVRRYAGSFGDGDSNNYIPKGVNGLSVRRWGLVPTNTYYVHGTVAPKIPIKAGDTFVASVYVNTFRCNARITVAFYDASGNNLGEPGSGLMGATGAINPTRAYSYRCETGRITAPAGAVSMAMLLWLHGTGESNPSAFFWEPQIEIAAPTQTAASPYAPRGDDLSLTVPSMTDLTVANDPLEGAVTRIGMRVLGSRQQLGGPRNLPANQVMGFGAVNNATPLTANSSGQVTVNAFTVNLNGETVSYNAVTNAVVGLAVGATYVIYTIDPYADGGTRTWYAATTVLAAQQQAMGVVVAGTVTIPTSGSSGGGNSGTGDPDDWCVDWDTVLPDGRLLRECCVGDMIECIDVTTGEVGMFPLLALGFGTSACYKLTTPSGAAVVQSYRTAMDMPDGSIVRTPDMLGKQVWQKIDGVNALVFVDSVEFLGERKVVRPDLGNRMFFAGVQKDKTIATHNLRAK